MADTKLQNILKQLVDHEKRIRALETDETNGSNHVMRTAPLKKNLTLLEIVRGRNFSSGQEKVALVVGYYEKILQQAPVKEADIKEGWMNGKFDGKYRTNLLQRAVRDGLVRDLENGTFDLSQSGEKFFDNFLKPDAGSN